MKYDRCNLPNGIQVTVTPVFGGFKFNAKDHARYNSFPPEWIVCLHTRVHQNGSSSDAANTEQSSQPFTTPSLNNDALYLTSMSLPSRQDQKPGSAPLRQVAMVLWITFLWYFHEPSPRASRKVPKSTPRDGETDPVWRLTVQRRGMLCRKDQMMKLQRLGLVASVDTSVGAENEMDDFSDIFISQRAFWQLDPRIYLFSLSSVEITPGQVCPSPTSALDSLGSGFPFGAGPNTSGSFLPSYYPPQPVQYVYTGNVRHPLRPKPYRQGEVFYARFIPSGGEYLTFRVPVMPLKNNVQRRTEPGTYSGEGPDLCLDSDLANDLKLVYEWTHKRPQDAALPQKGSLEEQSDFLRDRLSSQNSFPSLVCWDSSPVGYFELFWVLEDPLGRSLENVDYYDRGVRCFLGDRDFLQINCIKRCASALVHHCWVYDQRTCTVVFEYRADNLDTTSALRELGFTKLHETREPDAHNMIMVITRDAWVGPEL
ncbi:acyl-CoA N-acyltransferase [Aspergillus germanicus]